ncbi:MAG: transcription-repair coupling factor [Clostridiales Family XIII bacterium]|jgi:transcription-repair coupling factor (superfamily II helicase)|nr:transcription-repair coupling factor [Clostridiales Family XIII bacterium]
MADPAHAGLHHAGLEDLQAAPAVADLARGAGRGAKVLVVLATQGAAASFAKQIAFFLREDEFRIVALPEDDPPFLRVEARSREAEAARLEAMAALTQPGAAVIVCPVSAAIKDVCRPEVFKAARIELSPHGSGVSSRDGLISRLAALGYRREPYTESPGEFSARGDIVDIFPMNSGEPYRVSFFDADIENIRPFEPETQKSRPPGGLVFPLVVAPAEEPASGAQTAEGLGGAGRGGDISAGAPLCLADWIGAGDVFACLDPARVLQALELRETEALHDFEALLEEGEAAEGDWYAYRGGDAWCALLARKRPHLFTPYGALPEGAVYERAETVSYEAKHTAAFYGQLDLLSAELKRYLHQGFTVTIVASTKTRLDTLRDFAEQEGLADRVGFAVGELAAGFELTKERLAWLWDGDIFRGAKKSRRSRLKGHEKIAAFTDIEKGDYIVHEKHGIGVYKGIRTIEAYGSSRDYLTIAYAGQDILYIPVEQMERVQKYVGGGEKRPRVSKLGTDDWTRTKARVRAEIEEYAAELIGLAAERKLAPGFAFSPDTVWQKDFEDRFPFEPTPDQLRCFEAVRRDMENPWPMDRLICGDVGYGKTEVALRAIFKCVQDGKQAAVLVPTTILAAQHFRTFTERFADFPMRVEMLSRFQSGGKRTEIFAGLKDGGIDIIVGTHSLLSARVGFKDLGLLVIDEEQRFGVKHKEKLRALKAGVDILTLTATPIPRTLNMSLLGIKDMELIEDPPEDRYPIRTYVSEERPDVISESIRREIDRGGQIYVVYNRVNGIERVAEMIKGLVPSARVGVCHARMNERAIEEIMQDFYENAYDVLLSTTIIESGLDIPNVNTIVILDADRLGLTQLYQLRGRVGRTNRVAFAYLMYRRDKVMTEAAEKRLRTIREFTEFGSGFKIAMKDLEIRGAGNLLGVSQHGQMAAVGYELYCQLMDEAVSRLAGRAPERVSPENECRVELSAPAVIPAGYIEDEVVKLQAYKRISFVSDAARKTAVLEELGDRFGPAPAPVRNLVHAALFRHLGEAAGLSDITVEAARAVLVFRETPPDLMRRVFKASECAQSAGATLEADMKFTPKLKIGLPRGASDETRFEALAAVLSALAEAGGAG